MGKPLFASQKESNSSLYPERVTEAYGNKALLAIINGNLPHYLFNLQQFAA